MHRTDTDHQIRRLWIKHSIAEDRRDLDGLIDTLAEDCVYEVVPTGQRWEGHDGARTFYQSFLGAFPDVKFHLLDIVIGPQGVMEVADMTGTHRGPWAGLAATGRPLLTLEQSTVDGCQTFDTALYDLFVDGRITKEDALHNAESANNLRLRFERLEGGVAHLGFRSLRLVGEFPDEGRSRSERYRDSGTHRTAHDTPVTGRVVSR